MAENAYLKVAAREGERHEQWVIADLESEAWEISDRQREVKLQYPAFELLGHIDGIAKHNGSKYLLEVKSMSRFRYQSFVSAGFERFQPYAYQITAYQKAIQLPVIYVIKNRDSGQMKTIELEKPPLDFEEVYEAVLSVELAVRKKQLCPAQMTDDFTCRTCRFRYLCQEEQKTPVPVSTEIIRAAGLRRRALELESEAKELRAEADPVLLAAARERGKMTVEDLAISYVPAGESVSYPVTELRKLVSSDILEKVKRVKERSEYIRVDDLRD
jgi:CRISPR/Cas system-associated exonuclease Cas4 (RecB family)